jgi:hypothetical protein
LRGTKKDKSWLGRITGVNEGLNLLYKKLGSLERGIKEVQKSKV